MRSSAAEEDSGTRSFAGLFESVLGVPYDPADPSALEQAIARVRASTGRAEVRAYRARAGAAGEVAMAVVVQELVDPAVSGVAFSCDPLSGQDGVAVVSAVYGLGEGLVSGELDADTYRVGAGEEGAVEATCVRKPEALRPAAGGGTTREPVPEDQACRPALTDAEARRVAACARGLARALGGHQDVEWALVGPGRRLVVLQARPVTTVRAAAGEPVLWDNSNIVESYSGVTTPLTFSFARAAYETVYRQFCEVMGVSRGAVEAHAGTFARMLGLVRGRVYYNLRNWYRMLALLPGFEFNRGFMERMMGVREALAEPVAPAGAGRRAGDLLRLLRMGTRMVIAERRLDGAVPRFQARVERALARPSAAEVASWPAERALAHYRRLEHELLRNWRTPIVNDFFAMVFFGTLGRLTARWLPEEPPTLVNDLLCGEGGIISTTPARTLMALAREADATPAVAALFDRTPDDRELWVRLASDPAGARFHAALEEYRARFGDRCMEELKLETVTPGEEPWLLLSTLRAYRSAGCTDPAAALERERAVRRAAEERVRERLRGVRRRLYGFVLARARRRVRDRENLRFERTRVFGMVRRLFLAVGADLAARGAIDEPRHVFWLTVEEVFAHFEGTAVSRDLHPLVAMRRAEFEEYARTAAPPDRFETRGPPGDWRAGAPAAAVRGAGPAPGGDEALRLAGTGCCPGVVRAPVRVVRDPRGVSGLAGRILVAERTDPGWTLLFPVAAGLLVERGSLLSHSAIVAREIGLPCVVGVPGLLAILADGDEVEMDGAAGVVRVLARAARG